VKEPNKKRGTRSLNAKLVAIWDTLNDAERLRALRVLAAMTGPFEVRGLIEPSTGTPIMSNAAGWDLPHA